VRLRERAALQSATLEFLADGGFITYADKADGGVCEGGAVAGGTDGHMAALSS